MAYVNFLEVVYPVGSCYFSVQSTSPAAIVGGTWTQLTGGVLGLAGSTGVADAGKEGGSRKISVEQMPSHNHITDGRAYPETGSQGPEQKWEYIIHLRAAGDTSDGRYTKTSNNSPSPQDLCRFISPEDMTTGGGAGLHSCSLLCLLLGAHLLASLAVM